MTLLIAGLLIWTLTHWLKRLAPELRGAMTARMGEGSKGVIAVVLIASIVLMIIGYRGAEFLPVYTPMAGIGHLNNLLVLVAFYFYGIGAAKGVLASKFRHPMLWGTVIWAVAHLLVNGDVASVVLFGGMIIWALGSMVLINRAEGPWDAPDAGPIKKDIKTVIIALVIFAIVAAIHLWLGKNPFLGTYG